MFISIEPFKKGRLSDEKCEYEYRSTRDKSGDFMSPTYPGTYPSILDCSYRFIAEPNERILIHFEEISIHYGAEQYVKIIL